MGDSIGEGQAKGRNVIAIDQERTAEIRPTWTPFIAPRRTGGEFVSVSKGGGLRLSKEAWTLLGTPDGVAIFVDQGNGLVGFSPVHLRPTDQPKEHVYGIKKDGTINARGLVTELNLAPGRYATRPDVGGLLAINIHDRM